MASRLAFLFLFVTHAVFAFDHGQWDAVLKKNVVVLEGGKASQFRYADVDRNALKAYLASLSKVEEKEFKGWSREEQMAFLINAYNAFTVEKILTRYPDIRSIWDFGKIFGNPFKDEFFTLLGRKMSLDGIEHGILRKDYREPRVHYAVNCASIGCPMLREEAYVAARLERQLEEQAVRFLSDRSRNRISRRASRGVEDLRLVQGRLRAAPGLLHAPCEGARLSRRRSAAHFPRLRLVPERLSIVVPALNEAAGIGAALEALAPLRARGHEVIVVDGGSDDATARLAAPLCDRVVVRAARPGLANECRGARGEGRHPAVPACRYAPSGNFVLENHVWGRFDVRIEGAPLAAAGGRLVDEPALPAHGNRHRRPGDLRSPRCVPGAFPSCR
jgi:hypothetical protein